MSHNGFPLTKLLKETLQSIVHFFVLEHHWLVSGYLLPLYLSRSRRGIQIQILGPGALIDQINKNPKAVR
jgi:hypothetical protein